MIIRGGKWSVSSIGNLADQQAQIRAFSLQGSLGAQYLTQEVAIASSFADQGSLHNISLLKQIVTKTIPTATSQPSDIIIHLRLGDNMKQESFFNQSNFNEGHQAPHSQEFFQSFLQEFLTSRSSRQQDHQQPIPSSSPWPLFDLFQKLPAKQKIILMGNYCSGGWKKTARTMEYSQKYVADLSNFITKVLTQYNQTNQFEIVHRLTHSGSKVNKGKDIVQQVDGDVAYTVATAGTFVCSGGSFSHMLAALVLENGGQVYGCRTSNGRYQSMFAKYSGTQAIRMDRTASI